MVQNATDIMGENGPDLLGNVYAPRGNIQINSPFLEVSAFNPRSRITLTFRKTEKRTYVFIYGYLLVFFFFVIN